MAKLRYRGAERIVDVILHDEALRIGRDPECDICLSHDKEVSRFHCDVEKRSSEVCAVLDNGSTNGTWVNGKRIGDEFVTLHHGDKLRIGQTVLTFVDENQDPSKQAFDEVARELEGGKGYHTIFTEIVGERQPPESPKTEQE